MLDLQRIHVRMARIVFAAGVAMSLGVPGGLWAQAPSATVNTVVNVNNAALAGCTIQHTPKLFQSDSIPTTACFVPVTLPGVGPGVMSQATFGARALAPSVFDPLDPASYQLARLGTTATISSQVVDFRTALNQRNTSVQSFGFARHDDYLRLGPVRPASMQLTFHLSGQLAIDPIYDAQFGLFPYAEAQYSVTAQSGQYSPFDSTFGSWATFGQGSHTSQLSLSSSGAMPTFTSFLTQGAPGQFSVFDRVHPNPLVTNTRLVTVDLGSDFFSNPLNDVIYLGLGLSSRVDAPLWLIDPNFGPGGYLADVSSSFYNTFTMTGIQAFDANGVDITSDAVLGFGSMDPPASVDPSDPGTVVPEPGTVGLLATGLVAVAAAGRRRRRRAP